MQLDHTHDAAARSWVASANVLGTPFPLQNLPFAIFRRQGSSEPFRGGVALGDVVIDVAALVRTGLIEGLALEAGNACALSSLNAFFDMGPAAWRALRHALFGLFEQRCGRWSATTQACLVPRTDVEYGMPASIGDYTDFYTSIDHARNIMRGRPGPSLSPNFQWMPMGYHGRVSSIGLSGQRVRRPRGQRMAPGADTPEFAASARLDYELELGIFIGKGNPQGTPIPVGEAEQHVFGLCLLNDWSARDIQAWESAPLGPFLAKNFATTISPWIVTMDALAPFRCGWHRPSDEPQPLAYLDAPSVREHGSFDIQLEVWLKPASGSQASQKAGTSQAAGEAQYTRLSRTSFRHQYWTVAQMVAHHAMGGCNLRSGDLFGSGTISGPGADEAGALIELTRAGSEPVPLTNGERRGFLEDGDTVLMKGWCERDGYASIGFGEAWGEVLPALQD
jgi:fumarylacetoacetase